MTITLTIPMVMSDTGAMLDCLANNPRVAGHVGVIGYYMSGRYVVAAAASYPQKLGNQSWSPDREAIAAACGRAMGVLSSARDWDEF